jgi:hypothetical protein
MTSSSAYIIGSAHYGPKIKRDYASSPKRNKYNTLQYRKIDHSMQWDVTSIPKKKNPKIKIKL